MAVSYASLLILITALMSTIRLHLDCFFFFSSRRRHTRCLSDWSSDVCSSDLGNKMGVHSDPARLAGLLDAKVIKLAIIDGADQAGQSTAKADPARQLFAQNYRILRRPD